MIRSLPLLILAALAGTWLIILNPGMYWDDWVWVFQPPEAHIEVGRELGVWWSGYFNNFIYSFQNSVFILRIIAFVGWCIGAFCFTWVIKGVLSLTTREALEIGALIIASQACLIRFLNSTAFYNVYFMAFWIGAAVFIYAYHSKYSRLLSIPFFLFSFYLNSFLVVYCGGLLVIFITYVLQQDIKGNQFVPQKDFLRNFILNSKKIFSYQKETWFKVFKNFIVSLNIFILLPGVFFLVTKLMTTQSKLYGSYNHIEVGLIFGSFFQAIPLFFKVLNAYFSLYERVPLLWILFFTILIYACVFLLQKNNVELTWPRILRKYFLAIAIFSLSIAPYLIVKKTPDLRDFYESRHGLIAIPAIILFIQGSLDLILKLVSKRVKSINKIRDFIFALLMGCSIASSNIFAMQLWGDWLRQSAIINFLADNKKVLETVNLFIIYDNSLNKIGNRKIWNYEYTGNVHQVMNKQSYFAVDHSELESWPPDVPLVHEDELKKRFLMSNFQFSDQTSIVALIVENTTKKFNKHEFIKLVKSYISLKPEFFPEKFIKVSVTSVANTTSEQIIELQKINKALEQYKLKNGAYPPSQILTSKAKIIPQLKIHGLRTDISAPLPIYGNIPYLFPKYLTKPALMSNPNSLGASYVYFSDGIDYKLVYMNSADVFFIKQSHPDMIDPKRQGYGFWTDGAENW
jgi:hypothetical protein